MTPQDISELQETVGEYKDVFDTALNLYGADLEGYFASLIKASARVQKVYYDELVNQGFSEQQSFILLLDARNAIKSMDLASKVNK